MAGRASDKTVPINVFDCGSPHSQTIIFFWIIILSHYPHVSQLLLFLDTLYSLPRDPYRELLASIDRVLGSAYSEVASTGPSALSRPVSDPIKQRLDGVILATFSSKWAVPSTFAFIEQYEKPFLSDFASLIVTSEGPVPNASFPSSLQELTQRLLLWKDFLRSEIQRGRPNPNAFFGCKFLPNVLEVPGKFLSYNNFYRSLPTVQSIAPVQPRLYLDRHGLRYFALTDERSREARFYLEHVNGIELILEERVLAQQIYFEKICFASPPIQSRHLHAPLPCYVNIGPTLRLVRSDASMVSFEGVYQSALQDKFDKEQFTFSLRLFFANHSDLPPSDALKPLIAAVPREKLLSSVIPSDTLTSFVYRAELLGLILDSTDWRASATSTCSAASSRGTTAIPSSSNTSSRPPRSLFAHSQVSDESPGPSLAESPHGRSDRAERAPELPVARAGLHRAGAFPRPVPPNAQSLRVYDGVLRGGKLPAGDERVRFGRSGGGR